MTARMSHRLFMREETPSSSATGLFAVAKSQDGRLIFIHDDTVDRTTGW